MIVTDRVTSGVAIAAVGSPVWLPVLTDVSQVAALLLPIFGVLWLLLQMGWKIREWISKAAESKRPK